MTRVAAETLRRWREDPRSFVREVFGVIPDAWQDETLAMFPKCPRLAMKACKGPGKTAVLAWIGWNFILTRPQARIGATSISGDNLKAGLWTELAIWRLKSPLLQAVFEMTKSEIYNREHPDTWKMEARTWAKDATPEEIGLALAGLHSEYVMWLLDESGSYPLGMLPTVEAIFSGNPIEAHVIQAGNATSREGILYHACVTARHLWHVVEITGDPDDPKRSPRIPVEHAREQINQFGRDNPWVKISIFGEFPAGSINSLISEEEITAATLRHYRPEDIAKSARILGVDVALEGDDASVVFPRQGLVAFTPMIYRNINGIQGAGAVSHKWGEWEADAAFVDASGGFGSSWIDNLRLLGRAPIGVGFAEKASDRRYYNKRAEMYFNAAQWIKDGGQLPPMNTPGMPELRAAFSRTTYTMKGDALLLEPKKLIKQRLGYSPDHADALALTFAHPVSPTARPSGRGAMHTAEWDFAAELNRSFGTQSGAARNHSFEYDPFA